MLIEKIKKIFQKLLGKDYGYWEQCFQNFLKDYEKFCKAYEAFEESFWARFYEDPLNRLIIIFWFFVLAWLFYKMSQFIFEISSDKIQKRLMRIRFQLYIFLQVVFVGLSGFYFFFVIYCYIIFNFLIPIKEIYLFTPQFYNTLFLLAFVIPIFVFSFFPSHHIPVWLQFSYYIRLMSLKEKKWYLENWKKHQESFNKQINSENPHFPNSELLARQKAIYEHVLRALENCTGESLERACYKFVENSKKNFKSIYFFFVSIFLNLKKRVLQFSLSNFFYSIQKNCMNLLDFIHHGLESKQDHFFFEYFLNFLDRLWFRLKKRFLLLWNNFFSKKFKK